MSRALLIIDYSNDFIDDDGALTCGKAGQAVDPLLTELVESAAARGDYLFICNDEHDPHDLCDPERKLFPPHNVRDTWGAELYGTTGAAARRLLHEQPERVFYLPKQRYSAFIGTPLAQLLRAHGVDQLTVAGCCTDICVLHTVISAVYEGFAVTVPAAACATIMPYGQEWALDHMKNCLGVTVV